MDRTAGDEALQNAATQALEALYNVPQVGEVYDQQHSDTHQRAALALREALGLPEYL